MALEFNSNYTAACTVLTCTVLTRTVLTCNGTCTHGAFSSPPSSDCPGSRYCWSSSSPSFGLATANAVRFTSGGIGSFFKTTEFLRVRAVRGEFRSSARAP